MSGFDIDFTLLPPKLQMKLWVLALDADTSSVNLAYQINRFTTSLKYNYSGKLEAGLGIRRFSTSFGINPGSLDLSLGVIYRGYNFGATGNPRVGSLGTSFKVKGYQISFTGNPNQRSFGGGFSYGVPLLPFPTEMGNTFTAAVTQAQQTLINPPRTPMELFGVVSEDAKVYMEAAKLGQQIHKMGAKPSQFGTGINLNFSHTTGFTIYGGALLRF